MIPLAIELNGENAWPELATKGFLKADFTAVALLERGTKEGMPTVTVRMELADGNVVLGQTTLRLFVMAADMMRAKHPEVFL